MQTTLPFNSGPMDHLFYGRSCRGKAFQAVAYPTHTRVWSVAGQLAIGTFTASLIGPIIMFWKEARDAKREENQDDRENERSQETDRRAIADYLKREVEPALIAFFLARLEGVKPKDRVGGMRVLAAVTNAQRLGLRCGNKALNELWPP